MRHSPSDTDGTPLLKADAADDYLRVHHALQERVLRELGLNAVWFESYEEMPAALDALRN